MKGVVMTWSSGNRRRFVVRDISQKSLAVIGAFVAWEFASRTGLANPVLLPPPTVVFRTEIELFVSGSIVIDILASLWRVGVGYSLAAFVGVSLGLILGTNQKLRTYTTPILEMIRPIPPVAFIPLSIMWFGIGSGPAFFLVFLGAFFPIFTNALAGVLAVDSIHRDAALCLGASRSMLLFHVTLPASAPFILAGLKSGLGTAWFCVIVAELVGAQSGLGYMIQMNRLTLQSERVLAGMVAVGSIGYLMNRAMVAFERRVVKWRSETRAA